MMESKEVMFIEVDVCEMEIMEEKTAPSLGFGCSGGLGIFCW